MAKIGWQDIALLWNFVDIVILFSLIVERKFLLYVFCVEDNRIFISKSHILSAQYLCVKIGLFLEFFIHLGKCAVYKWNNFYTRLLVYVNHRTCMSSEMCVYALLHHMARTILTFPSMRVHLLCIDIDMVGTCESNKHIASLRQSQALNSRQKDSLDSRRACPTNRGRKSFLWGHQ